ncbi:DEAD/DEAH box helicase [Planctomycetota bacterium]
MDVKAFLDELRNDPDYADQIVHVHRQEERAGEYAGGIPEGWDFLNELLPAIGVDRLYVHQGRSLDYFEKGRDILVSTGTASGKSLCYTLPLLKLLRADPQCRALLLFPTKALSQDQFRNFSAQLEQAGLGECMAGVYDGDTPPGLRRRLRDKGSVIFTNPDMLHAGVLPQHARWTDFFSNLQLIVLDELHVYNGIFGSNMALFVKRLLRICASYGSCPRIIAGSATIANPKELGDRLTGRDMALVDTDGSPRGAKTYVLWNPPRIRGRTYRSRRSANVEAHELMAKLVSRDIATITFSKAKMTAEMIHRYVTEKLRETGSGKASKVTPYRGGYLPEERREIEKKLFDGELLGVSTTPALELGIDVGSLEACILVGYPGTRASFFQQSGRAGRKEEESIVFFIGLDTSVNQYIMTNPEYVFEHCVEQAVIDPENPFVATGHIRCAAFERPLESAETPMFGPHADLVTRLLEENKKLHRIDDAWYYSASEVPNHEVSLRAYADANVLIEDADTGQVMGEVNRFDAEPIVHPEAIYMHRGDTYRVLNLDLEKNIATVKREEVDYYTQPLGGTDIHHIDQQLKEKAFGTGKLFWGEVTAYFNTHAYEKINFYTLDALSVHGLELPVMVLETMAFWIVPSEELMEEVRRADLDAHSGLRAIGYATRMLLPLFITCDVRDFSHTVGSVNSPWNAVFVYERYPHGLGFTEKAFRMMDRILPAVLDTLVNCPCKEGCPCCTGKPLRQAATWDVQRGEASIPSKAAGIKILTGLIGKGDKLTEPDTETLTDEEGSREIRLEKALRRRLERMREPRLFHPIVPGPLIETEYPEIEDREELDKADVARRAERRKTTIKEMHKKIDGQIRKMGGLPATDASHRPSGMKHRGSGVTPVDFPGRPIPGRKPNKPAAGKPVMSGDSLAALARKKVRKQKKKPEQQER